MLTISKPLNAGQAQTYHAKEFTSAEQNYWQEGDPALGEWQGRTCNAVRACRGCGCAAICTAQ